MAANPPIENNEQPTAPAAGPNGTQPATEAASADANAPAPPATLEGRLATRKDASLKEFLNKMDDYAPIVRPSHNPARNGLVRVLT
jgi:transcription initiation factor TFIID subunit 10